jgi:nicotinate-nucleotide adenylyltransferase
LQIRQRPIGILGGTFDPIHYGHLRIALEALEALELAELRLLPARRPPHRENPGASPEQRLTLLRLAVRDQPGFVIDERELCRDGPSYMVDTLISLRAEHPTTPLCLLVGRDAFAELPRWSRWSRLFELAHLVVLSRPGDWSGLVPELRAEVEARRLAADRALGDQLAGGIWFQDVTPLAISATRIRQLLADGRSPRYLLPDPVHEYILSRGLYRVPSRG